MALLRTITSPEADPMIEGDGVYLRHPAVAHYEEWSELREGSRAFLTPWEPTWPSDDLTRTAFRRRARRYAKDIKEDQAYPFFVFQNIDNRMVGGCTLSNVRRGVTQSCSLGYWIGQPHKRKGLMTAAVRTLIPYVFNTLDLHRLEAVCLPNNEASKQLLKGVGFVEEGYARRYLKINGTWRDHLLFAIVKGD
jgi:ribosomal-protein-alanine N-acetyltransferase